MDANNQTISHSIYILRATTISMAPDATSAAAAALKARKANISYVMAGYFSFIMRGFVINLSSNHRHPASTEIWRVVAVLGS
jgi:hypothetical protein